MNKITIPSDKRFVFPKYKVVEYKGCQLVIAHETAKWLVLDNKDKIEFFKLLANNKLDDALRQFNGNPLSAQDIVLQLYLSDFENTETRSLEPPMSLHLYVTNGCNLHCPHCYMSAGSPAENELNKDEIFNILKIFSEEGGMHITFSGGEPTIREDLLDLITYAKYECGLETEVYTNGIKWSNCGKHFYEELSKVLDFIQVSVDGYSEKKNARIRGKSIFNKVLNSLDNYVGAKIKTTLAITPEFTVNSKEDIDSYIAFSKTMLEKYDTHLFRLIVSARILDGRDIKFSQEYKLNHRKFVNLINIGIWGDNADTDILGILTRPDIKNNCAYGNISIGADGDIFFCSRITEIKPYSNVRNSNFHDIIRKAKETQIKSRSSHIQPCKDCELVNICGGDCRIEYFKEFRDCKNIDRDITYTRTCDSSVKESFYDLMIESQKRLYKINP